MLVNLPVRVLKSNYRRHLSKALQIDYSFGYTDATYDELTVPNQGREVNLAGNRQVFTPEKTAMLAAQFSPQISEWQSLKLILRGEAFRIGDQYFDLANTIKQNAYSLYNARAGVSGKNFELMFWIRNITDKRYISYAYDFGGTHLATL